MAPRDPGPFDGVDWGDLLPRLLLAARKLYYRLGLRRFRSPPTPEDLVQEAITSVLDGSRTPNPDVEPFHNLYWIMRSQADAFMRREQATGGHDGLRHADLAGAEHATAVPPSAPVEDAEFRAAVLDLVADDPLMAAMVSFWLDNGDVPARDLAEALGEPVGVIYTRTRKFKRRLRASGLL